LEAGYREETEARGVVVLGDMRGLYHHGCEAVIAELLRGLGSCGLGASRVLPGLDWERWRNECLEADLVVINGEGALHHDRPAVAGVIGLAEERRGKGRPTVLLNSSWFANDAGFARRLAAFSLVVARERTSARTIRDGGGPGVEVVPDLAFVHALRLGISHRGGKVCQVSDSTDAASTVRLRRLASRRAWEYLPVLAAPEADRAGAKARKIRRRVGWLRKCGPLGAVLAGPRYHAHLVGEPDVSGYLARLAAAGGVVSGRFHTVCFAIGLRVPFLALPSNTGKIEALVADAGLDPGVRVVPWSRIESVEEVPPFGEAERVALDRFAGEALARADRMFAELGRSFGSAVY
jgi:hypothetical protein